MWLDTDDAYWTLSNDYVESVWWLVRQMWDKGLIYEGFKVVPYCGRCGTALSTHEVAQGYEDVTEDSVYVRFPVVDARLRPAGVDDHAVDAHLQRRRRRRPRGRLRAGPPRPAAAGTSSWPRPGRGGAGFGRGALRSWARSPPPTWSACRYERPFDFLPIDDPTARTGWWPPTSSPPTTARASSTWPPPSVRSTARSAHAEGLPTLNPVDAAARFEAVVDAVGRAVRERRRPGHHRRPRGPPAGW